MRQHVNPLSRFFQLPKKLPQIEDLFDNYELPIHLDIGSARGKFLLDLASTRTDWNYLGLEIRNQLVVSAEREREMLGLANLKFLFCNVNVSLESWLREIPLHRLQFVSIQFPDPWFKKRHQKRRVVRPSLILLLASALEGNCQIFIQSDVLEVMEDMTLVIESSGCFDLDHSESSRWILANPFNVPTERECYVEAKGLPVYRAIYKRNYKLPPKLSDFEHEYQNIKDL